MDKAPDNPLDGPILDPENLPYGLGVQNMPPGAAGFMLWVNSRYIGFVPNTDETLPSLRRRVAMGEIGGPIDGAGE